MGTGEAPGKGIKMKKWMVKAGALLLALSLCGCGKKAADIKPADFGTFQNGVYENAYAGVGIHLDQEWTALTAQEIQDLPDNAQELVKNTEISKKESALSKFMDFTAYNPQADSFNIACVELTDGVQQAYLEMSQEQAVDGLLKNMGALMSSFASAGMDVQKVDKVQVSYLGKQWPAIQVTSLVNGSTVYMLRVMDYSLGGKYGMNLSITSLSEERLPEILNSFYALK